MDLDEETFEGRCVCGAVRIAVRGRPIVTHGCHCRFCQQGSGSAFAVNLMIEADRVVVTAGAPVAIPRKAGLGTHTAHVCPACQTELWGCHPLLGPGIAFVGAGVLDRPGGFAPNVHCFTRSKFAWVALPPDVPAFEGNYDMNAVWSDEAKARVAAARADVAPPQGKLSQSD